MSKLRRPNGDDHPEAALKHLIDSQTLLDGQRPDGAAYLSGYVVECALKSILLLEAVITGGTGPSWSGGKGHDLSSLESAVATLAVTAGAKTARYVGSACSSLAGSPILAWNPEQRYRPEGIAQADAEAYHTMARDIYAETIAGMVLNGDL
ncbi:MAG TPA: hypothetical protein VMV90_04210 [Rectinemataceae bacterium]|nr:hypothetical protein [Rectinemataceae bacterium]